MQQFPFEEYLRYIPIDSFQDLEDDRRYVQKNFTCGDDFLYRLVDVYVISRPIGHSTDAAIGARIDLGEAYLAKHVHIRPRADEIYHNIGYFLLGTAEHAIEDQIIMKRFDPQSGNEALLVARLERDHVYLHFEESTSAKITEHLKHGDLTYLGSRLATRVQEHKKAVLLGLIACVVIFLLLRIVAKSLEMRKLRFLCGLLAFVSISLFLADIVYLRIQRQQVNVVGSNGLAPKAHWKLVEMERHFAVRSNGEAALSIYRILNDGGNEVGKVLWLQRPEASVTYLAYHKVPKRFQELQSHSAVMLATTGGFTNGGAQPEGFTTENGEIVNAVMERDRDALVIFTDGGLQVLNLKGRQFRLPKGGPVIDNPRDSLIAYSKLMNWCRSSRATVFQTQLLAFSDKILIDETRAKAQLRERRILALASNRVNHRVNHVLVNLPTPYFLPDATQEIVGLMEQRHLKVEALLNLDVGAYNILNVYDESGRRLPSVEGTVPLEHATNLLIYIR